MRFPLVLAAAVFPTSLFAAGTTAIGPCPPGFVETGPRANGPVTIVEGRTGGNVGCVPAPPLRAAEPAVQPTPFPVRDFRDPMPADASVLRLVSYNPPSPTALAQQTSSRILARTYDLFDRVESETVPLEDGGTATVRYTYWRDGLRKTLTDAFGRVTFYEYDGQARLSRVTANQGLPDQHVTEYAYWPDDLLKTITAPNGVVTSYGYDLADRVTSIDIARDGVTLASYAYTYDANGNRLTQTETNGGDPELTTYTYDARDRLKTVTYPSGTSVEYGYDPVGNRIGETEREPDGTVVSEKVAVFDAINRLSSVSDEFNPSNNAIFEYDANGNLTSKTTAAGTETYDYEPRDLMVEARQGTTVVARYAYDAFGRRYLKVSSEGAFTSVVRQYLYDQTSLLHELDDASLEVAKYEYGGDRLASLVRRDEPRRFYHQDALGSVVALSDSAGAVVARYHLDAWGRYRTPSELDASANRFGFTGYLFDQETSLYYAKARFYDPEYGRFTSQDSVLGEINEPPSLHRYFYGYANPLRYVDPTGHAVLNVERLDSDEGRAYVGLAEQLENFRPTDDGGRIVNVRTNGAGADMSYITRPTEGFRRLVEQTGSIEAAKSYVQAMRASNFKAYAWVVLEPTDYTGSRLDEHHAYSSLTNAVGTLADMGIPNLRSSFFGAIAGAHAGDARDVSAEYNVGYDYSAWAAYSSAEAAATRVPLLRGFDIRASLMQQGAEGLAPAGFAAEHAAWLAADAAGAVATGVSLYRAGAELLASRAAARGLGDASTSPWLADPRAGVASHLEQFRGGGSFLIPESRYQQLVAGKSTVGDPAGQFLIDRSSMDQLLKAANGDINMIRRRLGIPQNAWNEPLRRIDVNNPLLHNARLPSGLERGANDLFKWGGYTKRGIPEIVIDPAAAMDVTVSGKLLMR